MPFPYPHPSTPPALPPHAPGGRATDEFPAGASEWPAGLSRRQFVELMAASLALAGLGACNRPPSKTIVPYVTPPDRELLDAAIYYATAMPWEGYARGLLALSNSGRPTKLEGNPAHPDSLGATDAVTQAAVLNLYDPDRSRTPRQGHSPTAWPVFEDAWLTLHRDLSAHQGTGLAILTEPTTSPTFLRAIHTLLDRFPHARWYQHTPLARYDREQQQDDYDFDHADVILSIDADFLFEHPSALRYTRAFTRRRRLEHGRVDANRLYVIEPGPTVTGTMADHRLPASPARMRRLLDAVTDALNGRALPQDLTDEERRVLGALAGDLRAHGSKAVCVAGATCDPDIQAWAAAMNAKLGAAGVTHHGLPAVRSDGDRRASGDLSTLVEAMGRGEVDTLVVVSANPAYTAPGGVDFAGALRQVRHRIHLGSHVDETAVRCDWHVPESHFLESWSDVRAYDGTASIVQPLIAPMYESRAPAEFLFFLAEPPGRDGYDLVRETWEKQHGAPADFERAWTEWLNAGVIPNSASARAKPTAPADVPRLGRSAAAGIELIIRPDPMLRDGRWANNAWLQELPKPATQLVWDNAAHVSPSFAAKHGLKNGDLIRLALPDAEGAPPPGPASHAAYAGAVPVWVTPGQATDGITVHLGFGRTRAGAVGNQRGFDVYPFRRRKHLWTSDLAAVAPQEGHVELVSTQTHFSFEGRDIVRTVQAKDVATSAGARLENPPSIFQEPEYTGYKWGMSIDLGTCIGCKACVAACQAENNIPVVGKDQVSRGREMHWLRVDRYYDGDPDNPRMLHQPVPCMQCENAPCEVVCPVAATVHSSEGLNDMVFNRCVGTRYCSNNCPYKVRRFNFLDYREPENSPVYLQKNPRVTVRARGVMEKCTYCVQRIDAARITAERENRRIRDGELRTACQQVCPAEAIVFGDLNDPAARVRARKAEPTNYALLEELNTRPRTTYLSRITNRSDAAETVKPAEEKS